MKKRSGFVSNSSSASFVIAKVDLTDVQKDLIYNYEEECEKYGMEDDGGWDFTESKDFLMGSTIMDNFDMREYLRRIGVDESKVRFDDNLSEWEDDED